MLRERIAIILFLLPILIWVIVEGGWLYTGFVALVIGLAALEFGRLFQRGVFQPAIPILVIGSMGYVVARQQFGFAGVDVLTVGVIMLGLSWHLVGYERGVESAAVDFAISIAGTIYLGWLGGYLISLRTLTDGTWWVLLALPIVWLADTGAYFVGKAVGRHPLSPRLSPKKTWEGYLAGVLAAVIAGYGFTHLWLVAAGDASCLTPRLGSILGLIIGIVAPIGDLAVSMVKRQFMSKDTSNLIPGHGGVLDRIDSWLWAGMLGYYTVLWLSG
jgi:phosphatidate cytidylyltransferase